MIIKAKQMSFRCIDVLDWLYRYECRLYKLSGWNYPPQNPKGSKLWFKDTLYQVPTL